MVNGFTPDDAFLDAFYGGIETLLVEGSSNDFLNLYTDDDPRFCLLGCSTGKGDIATFQLAVFEGIFDDAQTDLLDVVADNGLFLVDWVMTVTKGACTVCIDISSNNLCFQE